jgi:hypothetical protein
VTLTGSAHTPRRRNADRPSLRNQTTSHLKKAPSAWIPAAYCLCFVLSLISINKHFLDKMRRFRFAFVAVSDIHSPLAR